MCVEVVWGRMEPNLEKLIDSYDLRSFRGIFNFNFHGSEVGTGMVGCVSGNFCHYMYSGRDGVDEDFSSSPCCSIYYFGKDEFRSHLMTALYSLRSNDSIHPFWLRRDPSSYIPCSYRLYSAPNAIVGDIIFSPGVAGFILNASCMGLDKKL